MRQQLFHGVTKQGRLLAKHDSANTVHDKDAVVHSSGAQSQLHSGPPEAGNDPVQLKRVSFRAALRKAIYAGS